MGQESKVHMGLFNLDAWTEVLPAHPEMQGCFRWRTVQGGLLTAGVPSDLAVFQVILPDLEEFAQLEEEPLGRGPGISCQYRQYRATERSHDLVKSLRTM